MSLFYKYRLIIIFIAVLFLAGCAAQGPYLKMDTALQHDMRTFDSIQYVPLVKLCDTYHLDWKWDAFTKTAVVTKNGRIALRVGSDRILVNGAERKLVHPVLMANGAVFVPVSFVRSDLSAIVGAIAPAKTVERIPEVTVPGRYAIRTIVLDAGHGGKDPGATGRRLRIRERDLTLAIARRLKNILEENGIRVIMTRDTNTFVSLPRRVEVANKSNADLFVSVHINASRARMMSGFECYYLSEATDDNARALAAFENASLKLDEDSFLEHSKGLDKTLWDMTLTENRRESAELASSVCSAVENNLITRNRGVRSARFYVLKGTRMPAVLVEVGYISNKYEELKLKDQSYLDRMADTIAQGILAYKNKYERTEGFTQ